MKNRFKTIFSHPRIIAILGIIFSGLLAGTWLYFWGAEQLAPLFETNVKSILFKGEAIVIGVSIVRFILIVQGKDVIANWIDKK